MDKADLVIPQGTTWRVQWPITDANGDPLDLTGYTAKSQVRKNRGDATALHEWSSADGSILLDAGTLSLVVEPATSSAWEWTSGVYDVELTSPTGSVTRVAQGRVTVDQEVTR